MFSIEYEILRFLQNIRTDFLNKIFEGITMFGEEMPLVLIIVILYFAFDKYFAQKLCFITATSLSINSIIKNFVRLPRPFMSGKVTCIRPETATGYSFPSAHTHNLATWSTVLAIKSKKIWVAIITAILIALVAFSRIFLGAHFPSDVIVGAILGVVCAIIGSIVYDKIENKKSLYTATILILTPFAILFLINPDPLFEDYYKFYGMIIGLFLAILFEEKYAPIHYNVAWWKKVLRIVIGIVVAYLIKKGLGMYNFSITQLSLVFDGIGYLLLIFILFGICPLLFKKIKI